MLCFMLCGLKLVDGAAIGVAAGVACGVLDVHQQRYSIVVALHFMQF
jgi:hypothetical protein